MKKHGLSKYCKLGLGGCLLATIFSSTCFAADHIDGPAAIAEPAADITDIFAWAQNGSQLNLILSVFPRANESSRFSDAVQYVFRVRSQSNVSQVDRESLIVCTFTAEQAITCALDGVELVTNQDASDPSGVVSTDGNFRVFAGLRRDPFFFAANNFNTVRRAVRDAAPSLEFDEAGCPTLDQATQDVLVSTLVGAGGLPGAESPATDFFANLNTLSIVVQLDRGLLGNGPLYAVSASTHRRP